MAMQFKHFNASHDIVLLTIHYAIIDVFENTLLRVYFNMQRANEILNSIWKSYKQKTNVSAFIQM